MEKFVSTSRVLLEKEREAEIEETKSLLENVTPKILEQKGLCLLKLHINRRYVGLFNRNILVLSTGNQMPAHNFTSGDIVGLSFSSGANDQIASGVVSKIQPSSISVAFDGNDEELLSLDESQLYKIVKLANDVTYRRLQRTLDNMDSKGGHLVNVLFGVSPLNPIPNEIKDIKYFNQNLDGSQRDAVRFALEQKEVAIIHGPPGTGKTTTVTEVIRQAVHMDMKVLVCAPSNVAVDNLVEKLSESKVRMVRIGHPARLLPSIVKHSLDAIVSSSDGTRIVADVRKDINEIVNNFSSRKNKSNRQKLREELKVLRSELKEREEQTVSDILSRCQVVLCTLTMASEDGPLTRKRIKDDFDLVVIDECSQALEVACWTALLRGKKCILAGDHNQLPPTILSSGEVKEKLEVTLMERLIEQFGGSVVVRMLTTQYRMHKRIMDWPSAKLYDGRLVADESVARHLLKDLPNVERNESTSTPLMLVDTSGCGFQEMCLEDDLSKGNEGEADIVCYHVKKLLRCGLKEDQIGVIVPYNLQVEILRQKLHPTNPGVEVKSVDGFQGREKEAILVSLVRSNYQGEVGFLSEKRRINVALTRARRHLMVVCDSTTVRCNEFIKDFLDYVSQVGDVVSAHDVVCEMESSNELLPRFQVDRTEKSKKVPLEQKAVDTKKSKQKKTKATVQNSSDTTSQTPRIADHKDGRPSEMERRNHFQEFLNDFMRNDSSTEHQFPPTLTALDRLFVHQICEELGLVHISEGEKFERYIRVSKNISMNNEKQEGGDELKKPFVAGSMSYDPLHYPSSFEILNNLTEDEIHDDASKNEEDSSSPKAAKIESTSSKNECYWSPFDDVGGDDFKCSEPIASLNLSEKPPKMNKSRDKASKSSQCRPDNRESSDQNFDEIIQEALQENSRCSFAGCKQKTNVLGQNCSFCKRRFCLSHHVAECHGCGNEAKIAARKLISREGKLFSGSGVPSKALKPEKRAQLKSKLDNRLENMAEKRKGAPHKSNTKK